MEILLSARGLRKGYRTPAGEVPVLQGVDLDVAAGEMVAVVGASGVGKSTLLHVLGTLDRPDGGSLRIAGEDVLSLAERAALRVPEPHARVRLPVPPPAAGVLRARERGDAAAHRRASGGGGPAPGPGDARRGGARRARPTTAPGRSPAASSSAWRWPARSRRLPRALLADEPTGNLDRATGRRLHETLRSIVRARGLTVVVVTHNEELARGCDRVLALEGGRLLPA